MKDKFIVGITGLAGSGKDEIAKVFVENGYTKFAFADKVKECLYTINPNIIITNKDPMFIQSWINFSHNKSCVRLADVIDEFGWDKSKKILEVRRLLQVFGTECGRESLNENIWIEQLENKIANCDKEKIVISDIRFNNEAEWIRNQDNSIIINIIRPDNDKLNDHKSELGIDKELWDVVIYNETTVEDFLEVSYGICLALEELRNE